MISAFGIDHGRLAKRVGGLPPELGGIAPGGRLVPFVPTRKPVMGLPRTRTSGATGGRMVRGWGADDGPRRWHKMISAHVRAPKTGGSS